MVDGDIVCTKLEFLISLSANQPGRQNENAEQLFTLLCYTLVVGFIILWEAFCYRVSKIRLRKKKTFRSLTKIAWKLSPAADSLAGILLPIYE